MKVYDKDIRKMLLEKFLTIKDFVSDPATKLIYLLYNNGITKGVKSKSRYQLGIIAVENIEREYIADYVKSTLKSRKGWKAVELQQLCDGSHLL